MNISFLERVQAEDVHQIARRIFRGAGPAVGHRQGEAAAVAIPALTLAGLSCVACPQEDVGHPNRGGRR